VTLDVFYKLLAILFTVALGWVAGRMGWLGHGTDARDPARVFSNAAFYIFVPALLFRTTARLDFAAMPWRIVAAYFVPAVGFALAFYLWQRWRHRPGRPGRADPHPPALPAARTVSASFGNSVQLGIPVAAALFGEAGLAIHIALVSLHALIMLTLPTVLVEADLARAEPGPRAMAATIRTTVRNTIVHPVVLPVLAGLAWNLSGVGLHPVADEALAGLGGAAVPVCLVLIGLSLAYEGVQAEWRGVAQLALLKLLLLPALVLVVGRWGFGLDGIPLAVVVLMAALPTGNNALIFAQRYRVRQNEATTAIVVSTVGFVLTSSLWLGVLAWLG
jgi:malonate transporter and related proteins